MRLSDRIKMVKDEKIKDILLPIKNIADDSVHLNKPKSNTKKYLDALEIFHEVLEKIFNEKEKKLEKITKKYNKQRNFGSTRKK